MADGRRSKGVPPGTASLIMSKFIPIHGTLGEVSLPLSSHGELADCVGRPAGG